MMATMLKSFGLDPKQIQAQAKAALALVESINEQLKLIAEQNRLIIEQNQITQQLINKEQPHENHRSARDGHNEPSGTERCPQCDTFVDANDDQCRGCGRWFTAAQKLALFAAVTGHFPDKRPV
jgi:sensor histidine kinase regulating citrate/malate metabolism